MSKVQMLRSLVKQRLTAAAEEIFGLFERTIVEYEEELSRSKEENERQQQLLDAVFKPQVRLHRAESSADVQHQLVSKEDIPPEQQDWSPILDQEDQEDQETPHIKEELWTSQEGEPLQGLEEADQFEFTQSADDDEEPRPSLLHQSPMKRVKMEVDAGDFGGPGPTGNSDPDQYSQPDADDKFSSEDYVDCKTGRKTFACSECGERFDCTEKLKLHNRVHAGGFSHHDTLMHHMAREEPLCCSVCGKSFQNGGSLLKHMKSHTKEKSFSCSLCGKRFSRKGNLQIHMRGHGEEKPYSCPFCGESFAQNLHLTMHMFVHTGVSAFAGVAGETPLLHQAQSEATLPAGGSVQLVEAEAHGDDGGPEPTRSSNPGEDSEFRFLGFGDWKETREPQANGRAAAAANAANAGRTLSCSECGKMFRRMYCLQVHRRIHTGEKPHCCSVCGKRFSQRNTFIEHTKRHTGQDMFCCSLCGKKFAFQFRLKNHMRTHTGEKRFHCSVCGKGFRYNGELIQHMNAHLTQLPAE